MLIRQYFLYLIWLGKWLYLSLAVVLQDREMKCFRVELFNWTHTLVLILFRPDVGRAIVEKCLQKHPRNWFCAKQWFAITHKMDPHFSYCCHTERLLHTLHILSRWISCLGIQSDDIYLEQLKLFVRYIIPPHCNRFISNIYIIYHEPYS